MVKGVIIKDGFPDLERSLKNLIAKQVLVGVPSQNADRQDGDPVNNATRAYIHDNGSPAQLITPRPFMAPGIQQAKAVILKHMDRAAQDGLDGHDPEPAMGRAGTAAVSSIRNVIRTADFAPLAESTILNRYRSRRTKSMRPDEKEFQRLVDADMSVEEAQKIAGIRPLINTGEMQKSITYVIRKTP